MQSKGKKNEKAEVNPLDNFPPHTYEEWREAAEKLLKGASFEKTLFTPTYETISLKPLYYQADTKKIPHLDSFPGFVPYLRGTNAAGYLANSWHIAQEIPYSTPGEFNSALQYDLQRGQTAVNMPIDKATIAALDSDEAKRGEVGYGGVTVSTLEDLGKALEGVDLQKTPIFIKSGSAGIFLAAFLAAFCRKQKKNVNVLKGCVETDPLGELSIISALPTTLSGIYDEMATLTAWALMCAPNLQTIAVHGDYFHDAGASAVQELAFSAAIAVEYIRELMARDLSVDDITPRIRFTFSLGSNFFMEIAKLRAARLVWSQIVESFGGNPLSQKMYIHSQTSFWNKTICDPYVNMLRATTETFSGIAGGSDSIHVGAFDETPGLPGEFSRRIARNTQLILKEESHLDRVIDPAGGSWYVEALTNEVAEKAWKLFREVEKYGGMFRALRAGFPQRQVTETTQKRLENLASRKDRIVGTNVYPNLRENLPETRQPDYEAIFNERVQYLKVFRTSGDVNKHIVPLEKLHRIVEVKSDEHELMVAIIDAAYSSATIGEIRTTLRAGRNSEKTQIQPLKFQRGAEMFEKLRKATEAFLQKTGSRPKVFLANMGTLSQYKARADFSAGFFQVGGFEVLDNPGFSTPEEAVKAALASGAPIVVICSSDENYPQIVEPLTSGIKRANPNITVVLAGYPKDRVEAYQKAGIDEFIHLRANVYAILERLLKKVGVLS